MPEFAWKAPLLFTLVHLYVWIPVPTADAFALRLERQAQSSLLLRNSASGVFVPKQELLCLKNNTGVPCVNPNDPQQCTKGASKFPAITFAFDMNVPWKFNQEWCDKVRYFADAMKADLVLLLPAQAAFEKRTEIPRSILKVIRKYFRIVRVPWVVPPKLSQGVPREGGCCGAREFVKLNAVGLEEYDAIVNLDTDFTIYGSLQPLFDCAASGHFLTARGSMSGVNGGMFAVRPSKVLLREILEDLQSSNATESSGWNGRGLAPGATYAQAGLQGFLYYYFYQRASPSSVVTPGQVDPCAWTGAKFCKQETCNVTPLRHKIKCPEGIGPPLDWIKQP